MRVRARGRDFLRRLFVLSGGVSLLFEFLEGCIFFEFLDVVGQVGFFLFDLFFLNRALQPQWTQLRKARQRLRACRLIRQPFPDRHRRLRRFTAEHRCYIHLVQALLFAVPVAGDFVHLRRGRRR